jgi:hypothetical protein
MADDKNNPEHSGSRWEPGADDETRRIADDRPAEEPAAQTAEQPVAPPDTPAYAASAAPATEKKRLRARSVGFPAAAAIAAGLVVVSGVGGYALGAATSGNDLDRVSFQRGGFPQGGPGGWGDRDDDGGNGDGHGVFPGPPPGTDDQMPGFPDEDGDGSDDGSGGLDGSDGGTQDSGTTT